MALLHSQRCAAITTIQPQNIYIIPKQKPVLIKQSLPNPFCSQLMETTNLFSVPADLSVLDIHICK